MNERPSFRRRADVRRLVFALFIPWLLGGIAYLFPLVGRELHRSNLSADWMGPAVLVGFYGFGFPAMLSCVLLFVAGIWWLVSRPAYRRSWYGWLWLVLMYLNTCGVASVIGH